MAKEGKNETESLLKRLREATKKGDKPEVADIVVAIWNINRFGGIENPSDYFYRAYQILKDYSGPYKEDFNVAASNLIKYPRGRPEPIGGGFNPGM
jgi:hypothetical protein